MKELLSDPKFANIYSQKIICLDYDRESENIKLFSCSTTSTQIA